MRKSKYLILSTLGISMMTIVSCNNGTPSSTPTPSTSLMPTSTPTLAPTPTPTLPSSTYAYFVNRSESSYTQCSIDANNNIESSSCVTIIPTASGKLSQPYGLAFNNNYVYFSNYGGNSYTQCQVGNLGIKSDSCVTYAPTGAGAMNAPSAVAINNNIAYFTNAAESSYTQCNINGSGIVLDSCTTITPTSSGFHPFGMMFIDQYVYFSLWADHDFYSYTQCDVDQNGLIESNNCAVIQSNVSLGLAFNMARYKNMAYFASDVSQNTYSQCLVDANGLIDPNSCSSVTLTPQQTGGSNILYGVGVYNGVVYFTASNNSYIQCNTGELGLIESASCSDFKPTGVGALNGPINIAFY